MELFQNVGYPLMVLITLPCHTWTGATDAYTGDLSQLRQRYAEGEAALARAAVEVALRMQEHLARHSPLTRVVWETPAPRLVDSPLFRNSTYGIVQQCTSWEMLTLIINYGGYFCNLDISLAEAQTREAEAAQGAHSSAPGRVRYRTKDDDVDKKEIIVTNISEQCYRPSWHTGSRRRHVDLRRNPVTWTARMPVRLVADLLRGALRDVLQRLGLEWKDLANQELSRLAAIRAALDGLDQPGKPGMTQSRKRARDRGTR